MPPKKKPTVVQAAAEVEVNSSSLLIPDVSSFEEILNKRLNEHTKELNAIVVKSKEVLHNDIKAIQARSTVYERQIRSDTSRNDPA
jgi:hypothetical protein